MILSKPPSGPENAKSPIETPDQNTPGHQPTPDEMEDLIDRYTDNLMRAALSLGFPEGDAEELVQATFCAFLAGGKRFERRARLLTYLFGTLYNKAREARRFQNRHQSMDAEVDDQFEGHFTPKIDGSEPPGRWTLQSIEYFTEVERRVQTANLSELLAQCLEGLNVMMRMAFTLKEVEGLGADHICAAMRLTPSNLGVILFRARNKLRECLTAKGAVIS